MSEKLHIPRYRYLTQNQNGPVRCHIHKPQKDDVIGEWDSHFMQTVSDGARNPDWQNTLIDLDAEGYTFEDGILKRAPQAEAADPKDKYKL